VCTQAGLEGLIPDLGCYLSGWDRSGSEEGFGSYPNILIIVLSRSAREQSQALIPNILHFESKLDFHIIFAIKC
jgi:hypothetical protein